MQTCRSTETEIRHQQSELNQNTSYFFQAIQSLTFRPSIGSPVGIGGLTALIVNISSTQNALAVLFPFRSSQILLRILLWSTLVLAKVVSIFTEFWFCFSNHKSQLRLFIVLLVIFNKIGLLQRFWMLEDCDKSWTQCVSSWTHCVSSWTQCVSSQTQCGTTKTETVPVFSQNLFIK